MKLRLLPVRAPGTALFAALLAGSFGCSSAQSGADPTGGAAGLSTANLAGASNLSGAGGANGGDSGVTSSACPEQPTPLRTEGTVLSLPLELLMAGQPFVFGQPNALSDGGSLVPLNFRFYISDVRLLQSKDAPVPVDVLTAAGVPEPYGVHLFNAEDADSSTLRVLAPAGDYTGIRFALGIKLACNQQAPASLEDPLTDASQMTWPHTGGFLFLRYEGRYTAADGSSAAPAGIPPAVHMGGDIQQELVPHVTVSSAFSIPANGRLEIGVRVAVDQVFKGATADIDVSDIAVGLLSTPEAIAGERLRRELPELPVFELQP